VGRAVALLETGLEDVARGGEGEAEEEEESPHRLPRIIGHLTCREGAHEGRRTVKRGGGRRGRGAPHVVRAAAAAGAGRLRTFA